MMASVGFFIMLLSSLHLLQICGLYATSAHLFREAFEESSLFVPIQPREDYVPIDSSWNSDIFAEEDFVPVDFTANFPSPLENSIGSSANDLFPSLGKFCD